MLHLAEERSEEEPVHAVRQLGGCLRQAAYEHVVLARRGEVLHGIATLGVAGHERIAVLRVVLQSAVAFRGRRDFVSVAGLTTSK